MTPTPAPFDAILLTGGRSSRLGGTPKALLTRSGETLVSRALAAAAGARAMVVVGSLDLADLPAGGVVCREFPAYGGPVAAIAAGLAALPPDGGRLLVIGCDMPAVGDAVAPLLAAGDVFGGTEALLAEPEGGQPQPLAGLYRRAPLVAALATRPAAGRSVRSVLAELRWASLPVPAGSCDDVDTWEDARRLGWSAPDTTPRET